MDRSDVRAKVQEILRDIVDDDEVVVTDETVAEDVVDWDSTNHVRLIVAVEEEFHVRFETDEITMPESVGDLVDLILAKLAA
ncbi:MAG: acyl carrier protein [Caulobacteraceae bacterium]